MSKPKHCVHKFILKFGPITEGYDVTSTVVVPIERRFVDLHSPFSDMQGYSKEIFSTLKIDEFPSELKDDLRLPLIAKYYEYNLQQSNHMRVIHLVDPILLERGNNASHRRMLKEAYTNIFSEFLRNSGRGEILRMVPLGLEDNPIVVGKESKGTYAIKKLKKLSSAYEGEMKEKINFTVSCLFEGLTTAERKMKKRCSHIELYTLDPLFFYGLEKKLKDDGIPLISEV